MGTILVESKWQVPVPARKTIQRTRLIKTLENSITNYRLILISAPAGYGKTTLLAEWARASSLPVAWLSISEEEDDVDRFLRYLLAAWEAVQPDIVETPLGILLGAQTPDLKAVLPAFLNAGAQAPGHLAFVLDDCHLLEEAAVHEALGFLLDQLPANLHFIVASRSDPPLPLARYRARRQLLEIRTDELQFHREETTDFLEQSMALDLLPEEVAVLHDGTEGWIAGLQLAALALRRGDMGRKDTMLASGRQRFIADYLAEEVLNQLPADQQDFLLKTSLLESLCGPLCDALLENGDTNVEPGRQASRKAQSILNELERANLFIIPLDDRREWFRYHTLFAEFLQGELSRRHADQIPELHRRAAVWYLAHEMPEQAFRHAVAGDHAECAIEILDKYFNAMLNGGEYKVIERWIDALPAEWFVTYPVLYLMRAGLLAYTGAFEACVRLVDKVEQRLLPAETESTRWQLARVQAVRCFIACAQNDLARAETYADRALRDLPDDDVGFRPGVYGALGDAYRRNGRWEEAKECYLRALDVTHSPTVRLHSAHVFGALADLELRQGHLQKAAGYWRKALSAVQDPENWGHLPLPVIGWVYIRMGELQYEWNQLVEAWDHVSRGLERAELGGDVRALIAGYLIGVRLRLAEGEVDTAAKYLEKARALVDRAQFPEWISQFERVQLEFWLAQDRLRAAVNWSDEMLRSAALEGRPESVVTQLAIARVLIVKGDAPSLTKAQLLLERLREKAEEEGQMHVIIEALTLKALANWQRGERGDAMISLDHALRLAEPEGYVRVFADLGIPMGRLLQEARARKVNPEYVDHLLGAFSAEPSVEGSGLPEPLTAREQEVLERIAAGLTNREIADALFISPETVKKHTGNIYGKLGVSNRTEAAARARELNLLG